MAPVDDALRMVDSLANELRNRRSPAERFERYYRGETGKLCYASDEFAKYFDQRYDGFSDNWTSVVADAPTERLETTGFLPGGLDDGIEADTDLWRVWLENDADYYSDLAWLDAIIAKRSFVLVWGNPADESTPSITFEHPTQAIVTYDPDTGARRAGMKLWTDFDAATEYATLYTPAAVWKFQRPSTSEREQQARRGVYVGGAVSGGWRPREVPGEPWPIANPLGVVPLVELPNRPRLIGEPMSDIEGVAAMQDAVNLIWAYLLNASDFASWPQRVVLGAERPKVPVLDSDGKQIGEKDVDLEKFGVDRVVWLEDPNTKIGEWSAANLAQYTELVEMCVGHIAAQSRTPPHYLMSKIVNANAETLKTAETGLVKRTAEKTKTFGRGLREMASLVCAAQGNPSKARAMRSGQVYWRDVEIRSEAQAIDSAQKLRAMGYPLEYISRRIGMSPSETAAVMEMIRREQELDPIAAVGQQLGQPSGPADESPPAED